MAYVFSHAFIPLSILYIFSGILKLHPKKIIVLSFLGIFPDLDVVFIHRETFHNIFILIIPLLVFFTKKRDIAGIICFYLLSHLILDLFNGGISALYPFYNNKFFINAEIMSSHNVGSIKYTLNYGIKGNFIDNIVKFGGGGGYGIMSSENIGTAILFIIMILISFIKIKSKKYK